MATNYAGYVRTKTRQQAQDERRIGQDRFDGGQDSDTPPVKIGTNELALAQNAVCFPDRVEGHYGRVLASDERLPGSGTRWDLKQHPVTGRWLLHRGDEFWLSAGRPLADWAQVSVIGPDGSLTATGSFSDGSGDITGGAAAFLSGMVLSGALPGAEFNITVADAGAGFYEITIDPVGGGATVAQGGGEYIDTAENVALIEQGGSGISGSVDVAVLVSGDLPLMGVFTVSEHEIEFSLRGLTLENTGEYELYWEIEIDGANSVITLYKDSGLISAVAETAEFDSSTPVATVSVTPLNGSGISGSALIELFSTPASGTYAGTPVTFSPATASISATSDIAEFTETGFMVFVRGATPHNIYVEQELSQYWFMSTREGYGNIPIPETSSGAYEYRYVTTYSRIVNATTKAPDYAGNRLSALLQFEGPSVVPTNGQALDYSTLGQADPIAAGDPMAINLFNNDGMISENAAAYITHISIYRTADVGVNGIDPNTGAANNSEIYVWVADVPIYSTTYSDTTDDATLLNRYATGEGIYILRSRFYREMEKGIGAIRPDFMATVAPQGTRITYCDVGVNPRFIGYHFPGAQFNVTQDPVSEIVATKDLFCYICPSSCYTSITAINVDASGPSTFVLAIQNFEKSSQNVGVKYGQRVFAVDDSSFVSLCSDGTVRIYSATFWGDPLDGDKVHKLIELAQTGAVLVYFRDAFYFWYTTDAEATVTDKCLRLGAGGQGGVGWTVISRANWVWPPVGGGMIAIWETDEALLRMIAIDSVEDAPFAIEDLPPLRQYEDDEVDETVALTGPAAEYLSNFDITGHPQYGTLYCIVLYGSGNYEVVGYLTEADRTGDNNRLFASALFNTVPQDGLVLVEQNGSGMSGVVDVSEDFPLAGSASLNFDVTYALTITGASDIASPLRFRALTATQQQFQSIHQESYVFMRSVYGMAAPEVAARWYADDTLIPASEQTSVPADGDIQSFAQVKGRTIQLEVEPQSSGWQLTGWNTKFQTQDMRSARGPWDSVEADLQKELMQNIFAWVLGVSGLINRADAYFARFVGTAPTLIEGPEGRPYAQQFASPVELPYEIEITEYSLMFWVKEFTTGLPAAPLAMLDEAGTEILYVMFPDATHVDIGSFQYVIPASSDWAHYCVTRDSGTFKTYRNGALLGSDALSPGTDAAIASLRIGAQKLYDPRLYSGALSAEAVAYYYNHIGQVPP